MKNLHDDKAVLNDVVTAASAYLGIESAIVEKDYYVSLLLKEINKNYPDIIFKGGTSLSKCYKIINRFSEDIDVGIDKDKATEGMRRDLKFAVKKAIDDLGFELDNADEIMTRAYFNKYRVKYPATDDGFLSIKPYLYVETAVFMKPFPYEVKEADTYVFRFLKQQNAGAIIEEYGLQPFEIKTQTLTRTFIDKVFAVGDCYLNHDNERTSRHLYDLHKLMPQIKFNKEFYSLFEDVKAIRAKDYACPSAKDGVNIKAVIERILTEDFFKKDYNDVTSKLLFENVSYGEAKESLEKIRELIKAN